MSDPIEGSVHPPQPTGDAAVLAAYRKVTDWTDEDVLHYAACTMCDPIGDNPYWCRDSPREQRFWREHQPSKQRGEPVRPQSPLATALRREAERIVADAKARMPLHHGAVRNSATAEALARIREAMRRDAESRFASGGVAYGRPGGPYCGVCGAPVEVEPLVTDIDLGGFVKIEPGRSSCPNGCDPRLGRDR